MFSVHGSFWPRAAASVSAVGVRGHEGLPSIIRCFSSAGDTDLVVTEELQCFFFFKFHAVCLKNKISDLAWIRVWKNAVKFDMD